MKKSGKNFNDARREKIKNVFKELSDRFLKSKVKEIGKDLHRTEN